MNGRICTCKDGFTGNGDFCEPITPVGMLKKTYARQFSSEELIMLIFFLNVYFSFFKFQQINLFNLLFINFVLRDGKMESQLTEVS